MSRILYFSARALESLRASPGVSILTAGTIAAALLVLGGYTMGLQNLERLTVVWGRSATIVAYIHDETPAAQWPQVQARLEQLEAVAQARLIRPREALARFRARGPQAASLVEGVNPDILPASVALELAAGFADLTQVAQVARQAQGDPAIADVDYGQAEFERLKDLLNVLRYGGLGAGILIALATALIVSNTIRLTVYARREEIGIQRLVGATAWFIRTPFLIEGALWGTAGGVTAAVLLALGQLSVAPRLSALLADVLGGLDLQLITPTVGAGLLVAGTLMGSAGSALAVRRFMDVETTR